MRIAQSQSKSTIIKSEPEKKLKKMVEERSERSNSRENYVGFFDKENNNMRQTGTYLCS
jgi:hypothetical protein